jgi:hypothetical protein
MASRSLSLVASEFQSLSARSIVAFSFKRIFALSELSQNPDVSVRLVSSASFASLAGVSKMPPQSLESVVDYADLLFQVFQKHVVLLISCYLRRFVSMIPVRIIAQHREK